MPRPTAARLNLGMTRHGETELGGRRLAAMTPGLVDLSGERLVDALLAHVVAELGVDTAVVLVVEQSKSQLVAFAAHGLEEEILQGFHLPIGVGFAGRIAATGAPLVLDELGPGAVVNPLISARGVRSMAGVPLIAEGGVVGVLHVGSLTQRNFETHDMELLQSAADNLAADLVAERTLADRTAARVLQRSLLPVNPPSIEGVAISTRFVPASHSGLGGDWYDVFELPDGRLGLVMGDVTGSGLSAAVVMGRLRSTLRAYAFESSTPGEALDRLNRKFMHFEPGQMATILYMIVSSDRETIAMASAGHPAPVVAHRDDAPHFALIDPNPPVGVLVARPTPTLTIEISEGSVIAAFTDGLYERRSAAIDEQLDKLRDAVCSDDPDAVCNRLMMTMVGSHQVEDDTALLVLRRVS